MKVGIDESITLPK